MNPFTPRFMYHDQGVLVRGLLVTEFQIRAMAELLSTDPGAGVRLIVEVSGIPQLQVKTILQLVQKYERKALTVDQMVCLALGNRPTSMRVYGYDVPIQHSTGPHNRAAHTTAYGRTDPDYLDALAGA